MATRSGGFRNSNHAPQTFRPSEGGRPTMTRMVESGGVPRTMPARRGSQSIASIGNQYTVRTNNTNATDINAEITIPMVIDAAKNGSHNTIGMYTAVLLSKRTMGTNQQNRVIGASLPIINFYLALRAHFRAAGQISKDGAWGASVRGQFRGMEHLFLGGADGKSDLQVFDENWNWPGIVFGNEASGRQENGTSAAANPGLPRSFTAHVAGAASIKAYFMPVDKNATHYRQGDALWMIIKQYDRGAQSLCDYNGTVVIPNAQPFRTLEVRFYCFNKPSHPMPYDDTRVDPNTEPVKDEDLGYYDTTYLSTRRYHSKFERGNDGLLMRVDDTSRPVDPNQAKPDVARRRMRGLCVRIGTVLHSREIPNHGDICAAWYNNHVLDRLPTIPIILTGFHRKPMLHATV